MSQGKKGREKRQSRKGKLDRVRISRQPKSRILLVGEGKETEPNYFRGLKREECVASRFVIDVRAGDGGSAEAVVKLAAEILDRTDDEYDRVFCILDVEEPSRRDTLERARRLATSMSPSPGLVLSNPAFECWLLAHFLKTHKSFSTAELRAELDKCWRREFAKPYGGNDKGIYGLLAGRTETAVNNAGEVREIFHKDKDDTADCNSSTEVYRLVAYLLGLS